MKNKEAFTKELEHLINKYSMENGSNTPDFILAEFLVNTLEALNKSISRRSQWYGPMSNESINVPSDLNE